MHKNNIVITDDFFTHIDSFLEYRKNIYEVSKQTLKSNLTDLNLFKQFLEDCGYSMITGQSVIDFQTYLKYDRENAGNSINRKIFTLRSYGQYLGLKEVEGAETLPFYDILKIRQGYRNDPYALTKDEVKLFFETINTNTIIGIRDYCIYGIMLNLGLRIGEVHTLDLDSVDLENKKIRVFGKGNKIRFLHISSHVGNIITDWLCVREKFINSSENKAFFISKKGNRISMRTMEDNFKNILARSGIKSCFKITPHTLRHTFASMLNDNGADILVLQRLLGHSTPRSTQIYIHPSEQKVRESIERLPQVEYVRKMVESGELKFNDKKNIYDKGGGEKIDLN